MFSKVLVGFLSFLLLACQAEEKITSLPIHSMAVASVTFYLKDQKYPSDDYFANQNRLTQTDKRYFDYQADRILSSLKNVALIKDKLIDQRYVFENPIYQYQEIPFNPEKEYIPLSFQASPKSKAQQIKLCEILSVDAIIVLQFYIYPINSDSSNKYSDVVLESKIQIIDRVGNLVFDEIYQLKSDKTILQKTDTLLYAVDEALNSTTYFFNQGMHLELVEDVFTQFNTLLQRPKKS